MLVNSYHSDAFVNSIKSHSVLDFDGDGIPAEHPNFDLILLNREVVRALNNRLVLRPNKKSKYPNFQANETERCYINLC